MSIDYYLPDSRDRVDMQYDFELERTSADRVTRDDFYCHEVLLRPYDGMLLSYNTVEKGCYSAAAKRRLYREGVRRFFRAPRWLQFMGDCGAFSYAKEEKPPYSARTMAEFYEKIGVDRGLSVDHIVPGFSLANVPTDEVTEIQRVRFDITLDLARDFLRETKGRGFEPIAAVQGWDLPSYQEAAKRLQAMGYTYLALGGLVRLKTDQLQALLGAVDSVRKSTTRLHLLGIARYEHAQSFAKYGVVSLDSTSPLRGAFMDARKNYWLGDERYAAIRIPPSNSPKIRKRLESGELNACKVRRLEEASLGAMANYASRSLSLEATLDSLLNYQRVHSEKDVEKRAKDYARTLSARPWDACHCRVCERLGHHVILLRGAERNRRRGFHNVRQFYTRLGEEQGEPGAVLISCGAAKRSMPTAARDLYTGSLYRAHLLLAERIKAPLFIMSAKHGLLDPVQVVAPYDCKLGSLRKSARDAWGQKLLGDLHKRLPRLKKVVVFAGKDYLSWADSSGLEIVDPLKGLTMGARLREAYKDSP